MQVMHLLYIGRIYEKAVLAEQNAYFIKKKFRNDYKLAKAITLETLLVNSNARFNKDVKSTAHFYETKLLFKKQG